MHYYNYYNDYIYNILKWNCVSALNKERESSKYYYKLLLLTYNIIILVICVLYFIH